MFAPRIARTQSAANPASELAGRRSVFRPGIIQAKLVVGPANDPLEHEADRIADHVMRAPASDPRIASALPGLQSKCAACEKEEQPLPTKKATAPEAVSGEAPAIVDEALRSSGQSLDAPVRAFMEGRFGHDFSHVRIHADSRAAEATNAVGALAYTTGHQIVFGAGQYNPGTVAGKELLAHELTHVVQQRAHVSGLPTLGGRAAGGNSERAGLQGPAGERTSVTGQATSAVVQRAPNALDDTAKKIIEAAKDTSKPIDQRAKDAVNSIVKAYYDPSKVDSVVYVESEVGLSTTPVGTGAATKGVITVGKDFVDHIDSFARRVLQVGHELEHVNQHIDGKGGEGKKNEREFLAFYWEATQPEKAGTGRMPHATRVDLIDEALRNYYCMPDDVQKANATKKDELLTLRSSESKKGGNAQTDPPTSCPTKK
jgi:hypothetical protein